MDTNCARECAARPRHVLRTFGLMTLWLVIMMFLGLLLKPAAVIEALKHGLYIDPWHGTLAIPTAEAAASGGFRTLAALLGMRCILAPFTEEVIFRAIPCTLFIEADGRVKNWWIIVGACFIGFGFAHGRGYASILLQGVLGLFLAFLWRRNSANHLRAYFSCVAAHAAYNFAATVIELSVLAGVMSQATK